MARMETQVEELPDNRVRLQVEVEPGDVRHAVEHAASDLAETMKIPGFRKGKVPMPVLVERVPVEERPVVADDTLVVDLVGASGEAQRDYVVELGQGRLLDELEAGLVGMSAGETKAIEAELADGSTTTVEASVKEIKEKVLPPLDDELARSTSEFETLAELREEIESRLREAFEVESEAAFRQEAVRALAAAAKVEASGALVEARTRALLQGLALSLEQRGISLDTYLQVTGGSADELVERLRAEARESVAGELVLEAAADRLGIQVTDEELEDELRLRYEDADEAIPQLRESGRWEQERESLRLARALDRVASEVQRIPADLAAAREKLWTPEKERDQQATTLWTPASKE